MNSRQNDLKSNDLLSWLQEYGESARPHLKTALVVVGILLVIAAGWSMFSSSRSASQGEAWGSLFRGLTNESALVQVNEDHPGSPAAAWAYHVQAMSEFMPAATTEQWRDRESAQRGFEAAIENFQKAVDAAQGDKLLLARAHFYMGQAYEATFDLENARTHYQLSLASEPDGAVSEMATRQLAVLGDPDTQEFYTWYSQQSVGVPAPPSTTPPSISTLPGGPSLNDLPDTPSAGSDSLDNVFGPFKEVGPKAETPTVEEADPAGAKSKETEDGSAESKSEAEPAPAKPGPADAPAASDASDSSQAKPSGEESGGDSAGKDDASAGDGS